LSLVDNIAWNSSGGKDWIPESSRMSKIQPGKNKFNNGAARRFLSALPTISFAIIQNLNKPETLKSNFTFSLKIY
jgi:hypothetical protein